MKALRETTNNKHPNKKELSEDSFYSSEEESSYSGLLGKRNSQEVTSSLEQLRAETDESGGVEGAFDNHDKRERR
jgi:hypothetical protein